MRATLLPAKRRSGLCVYDRPIARTGEEEEVVVVVVAVTRGNKFALLPACLHTPRFLRRRPAGPSSDIIRLPRKTNHTFRDFSRSGMTLSTKERTSVRKASFHKGCSIPKRETACRWRAGHPHLVA